MRVKLKRTVDIVTQPLYWISVLIYDCFVEEPLRRFFHNFSKYRVSGVGSNNTTY